MEMEDQMESQKRRGMQSKEDLICKANRTHIVSTVFSSELYFSYVLVVLKKKKKKKVKY